MNYRIAAHPRAVLLAFILFAATAGEARAFAAAVALIQDTTDLWKWPRELRQWQQVILELRAQTAEARELRRLEGSAASVNPAVVGSVPSVLDPTRFALALRTREKAVDEGRAAFSVLKTGRSTLRTEDRIEPEFSVFGEARKRDERRYESFSGRAALLARQDEAVRLLREVEKAELATQKRLLERLKAAKTQADVSAIHAALTASQQRCMMAAGKAEQARDECVRHESQLRLEEERRIEGDREWTEALVEKLKQRALASLHAQKGENN